MISQMKILFFETYEALMTNTEFGSLLESNNIDLFLVNAVFNDFCFAVSCQFRKNERLNYILYGT
jgi:hypothetical protein